MAMDPPSRQAQRAPWRLSQLVAAGTGAALVVGLILGETLAWLAAGRGHWWDPWSFRLSSSQLYDVTRSDIASIGLIGAGGAALIAYRRQRTAEDQHDLDRARYQLSEATDLRNRYTVAAEQLGHDRAAVRLAGVYALSQLADEWCQRGELAQRQVCLDVLCAYLRMPMELAKDGAGEPETRSTIVRVIAQHLRDPGSVTSWSDGDFDLSGAVLDAANFDGATFAGRLTLFDGVRFAGQQTSFASTTFGGSKASFAGATFAADVTSFAGASFTVTADFAGAEFGGRRLLFTNATFGADASFEGATVSAASASFDDTSFGGNWVGFDGVGWKGEKLSFSRAAFSARTTSVERSRFEVPSVSFGGASFSYRTSFANTTFNMGELDFNGAMFSGPRVDFDSTAFGGTTSFEGAVFSAALVSFGKALFDQRVSFVRAAFEGVGTVFDRCVLRGGGDFYGSTFSGEYVSFDEARFEGLTSFAAASLGSLTLQFDAVEVAAGSEIDLSGPAKWTTAVSRAHAGVLLPAWAPDTGQPS